MVNGSVELRSPAFSNTWQLMGDDGTLVATLQRHGRMHVSTVRFSDDSAWLIEPRGWGIVCALEEGETEIARITRRSWMGRRWDLTSPTWAYDLVSDHMPRRWHLAVGSVEVARIAGSPVSYNRVRVTTNLAVPVATVILAWHVIARPWEAAAAPAGLVPVREPRPSPRPATGTA